MKILNQNQSGQIIVILLLIMLVALSIGLAFTQKSVTDVTTSTQSEQSSRAFSAAEAGIEKALTGTAPAGTSVNLDNNATAQIDSSALLPVAGTHAAIEYPPIGRETTAQFWFTDPNNSAVTYNDNRFDLYFGNASTTDKPAVEVKMIVQSAGKFYSQSYYYDSDAVRAANNHFTPVSCNSSTLISSILGANHDFYCKVTVGPILNPAGGGYCPSASCKLILARVRLLYASENHSIALEPLNAEFPPQIQIYNSTGISGQSEKQIQAFRVKDVVPPWFDFAVFSVNEIRK